MHYEPWMLAAIDQAGYNGITDEHIATVAREIRLTGLTEISRQDFESACLRCSIDPDAFSQSDLDQLEDYLNDIF